MDVVITAERPDAPDAAALIRELDEHLAPRYPASSRYAFSVAKLLETGVEFYVLRADGEVAACGGVLFGEDLGQPYGEVKRMYVRPAFRGNGFGKRILDHVAARARERGVAILRLETGMHQVEAIGLYERVGFRRIEAFGPYVHDPLSRYYEQVLA